MGELIEKGTIMGYEAKQADLQASLLVRCVYKLSSTMQYSLTLYAHIPVTNNFTASSKLLQYSH